MFCARAQKQQQQEEQQQKLPQTINNNIYRERRQYTRNKIDRKIFLLAKNRT